MPKEFDLNSGSRSGRKLVLKSIRKLLRFAGNMRRSRIRTESIQICQRSVSKLAGHTSPAPRGATYGSNSGISRKKPERRYGNGTKPIWRSPLDWNYLSN
jgi:hypothetical protein